MAQVSLKQVRKVYGSAGGRAARTGDAHVAVAGATFDVADGELLVLVGPSGCGKSTLLRMIAGLESITSGTLRIGDRVVNDVAPKDRDIAMVFQNYALYPHMDVAGNLGFGLKLRGASKDEIAQRVGDAAKMLELDALLARKPAALSGGQRQRVALGRALVRDPQVFLLDEPLSNLDAKLRTGMRGEIARLHRQLGATMVYVTHDQVEAMTLGQRIVVLKDGHVQQIDTPMALYERPANLFVATFLGSPAMNVLRGRLVRAEGLALDAGAGVRVPLGDEVVPDAWFGRDIAIGVRPEHLVPVEAGGVLAVVEMVEALGNETLVNLRLGAQALVARMAPGAVPAVGSGMRLGLAPGRWHGFDGASGERLPG